MVVRGVGLKKSAGNSKFEDARGTVEDSIIAADGAAGTTGLLTITVAGGTG